MGSIMKVDAGGREFKGASWNEAVAKVAVAYRLKTTPGERVAAAKTLMEGYTATLDGIRITPKR